MDNLSLTTPPPGTRSSSPSATNCDVPPTSLQGTSTRAPPPRQGPANAEVRKDVLTNAFQGLRKHLPELYRQLRVGMQFDPDMVETILNIVDKASNGMPWPVAVASQAVLLLADNALQAHDNAAARDSLTSTIKELEEKLERLRDLVVPDVHQDSVKMITAKLVAASALVEDIGKDR